MGSYEKDYKRQADVQEPYQESSDESFAMDNSLSGQRLPSNISPEDYYQYKRFVNLPESQGEFSTKIDKDVVFANINGKKPNKEELSFQLGTIILFETEFVEEIHIPRRNLDGSFVKNKDGLIVFDIEQRFDEVFRGCLDFLKGEYKFAIVASRAMGGQDRAAFLDISSSNRISKEFSKKKETRNSFIGTGVN